MSSKFFRCFFVGLLASIMLGVWEQSAEATYRQIRALVQTEGQPTLALVVDSEYGGKQSFALGCPALASLWAPYAYGVIDSSSGAPSSISRARVQAAVAAAQQFKCSGRAKASGRVAKVICRR